MKKSAKRIPVPNILIDNKGISPKATYLYIILREMSVFKTGYVKADTIDLLKRLGWSDVRTLKKYCGVLKSLGLLSYEHTVFSKEKPLEYSFTLQRKNFEYIDCETFNEILAIKGAELETLCRIYLLYKKYRNSEYEYCWLSYKDITEKVSTSFSTVYKINSLLEEHKLIRISRGKIFEDSNGIYKRERNKYNTDIKYW